MTADMFYQAFNVDISKLSKNVRENAVDPAAVRRDTSGLFNLLTSEGFSVLVEGSSCSGAPRQFLVGVKATELKDYNVKDVVYSRAGALGDYLSSGFWFAGHSHTDSPEIPEETTEKGQKNQYCIQYRLVHSNPDKDNPGKRISWTSEIIRHHILTAKSPKQAKLKFERYVEPKLLRGLPTAEGFVIVRARKYIPSNKPLNFVSQSLA